MISKQQRQTLLVGGLASVIDWGILVLMVQHLHFSPQKANFPSLIIGASIQFFGNRYYVFKATERHYAKQMIEFILVEMVTFLLNGLIFYALVTWTPIYYTLARPFGSCVVFLGFSYPMWKIVFRKKSLRRKK